MCKKILPNAFFHKIFHKKWIIERWPINVLFWPYFWSQKSQLKFFDSSWTIFMCFCRLLLCPNDFEQILHGYFVLIPSCIFLTWIFKINSSLKYLQQCRHWCCFDPSTWIFLKWVLSVVFSRKNHTDDEWWYPYARNQYGFSSYQGGLMFHYNIHIKAALEPYCSKILKLFSLINY